MNLIKINLNQTISKAQLKEIKQEKVKEKVKEEKFLQQQAAQFSTKFLI